MRKADLGCRQRGAADEVSIIIIAAHMGWVAFVGGLDRASAQAIIEAVGLLTAAVVALQKVGWGRARARCPISVSAIQVFNPAHSLQIRELLSRYRWVVDRLLPYLKTKKRFHIITKQ
jgi:hypothetical protein